MSRIDPPALPYAPALAAVLTHRLAPIVPEGFVLNADGDDISLSSPLQYVDHTKVSWFLEHEEVTFALVHAVERVLNWVQDKVVETIHEPWPLVMPRYLPPPGARLTPTAIIPYYGGDRSGILALPPILFEELGMSGLGNDSA